MKNLTGYLIFCIKCSKYCTCFTLWYISIWTSQSSWWIITWQVQMHIFAHLFISIYMYIYFTLKDPQNTGETKVIILPSHKWKEIWLGCQKFMLDPFCWFEYYYNIIYFLFYLGSSLTLLFHFLLFFSFFFLSYSYLQWH